MELTRREALAAVAAAGTVAGGTGVATYSGLANEDARPAATLVALAETVYPSEVTVKRSFVETYLGERPERDGAAIDAAALAVTLDDYAVRERGVPFADIDAGNREAFLREIGVGAVPPRRNGTALERIHYLLNDLLFGLYTTPQGGRLVGNPNPKGHPGGIEHYQRGPE